jgi:hypothetical protein
MKKVPPHSACLDQGVRGGSREASLYSIVRLFFIILVEFTDSYWNTEIPPTHGYRWETVMVPITGWRARQNVCESGTTTTVHQDLDRVGGLTRLEYCVRRADRKYGGWGAGGTHCSLTWEADAGGRKFCVKIKWKV